MCRVVAGGKVLDTMGDVGFAIAVCRFGQMSCELARPIAGRVARPIAGPVARPISGPIAPPMHPRTLTQRRGDGRQDTGALSDRGRRGQVRGLRPECRSQKWRAAKGFPIDDWRVAIGWRCPPEFQRSAASVPRS